MENENKNNPTIELSRENLDRLYEIMAREVGMDSLDALMFEAIVERAFKVKLPEK